MTNQAPQELIAAALTAQQQAYAPYSQFPVGAALQDESGEIITGCNVENGSYGLTNCAERSAVCTAIADGLRDWTGLVVASNGGVSPCGACRQVLIEFTQDLPIWLVDSQKPDRVVELNLRDLLPARFSLE